MFGGCKETENFTCLDDMVVLAIGSSTRVVMASDDTSKLCFTCLSFADREVNSTVDPFAVKEIHQKMDLKSIYRLSKFIKHPFEAIGLIANYYALRFSTKIEISLVTV